MRYLAEAWGVGIHLPKTLLDRVGVPYPVAPASPVHKSPIESLEAAKIWFSARTLYINQRIQERVLEETHLAYSSPQVQQRRVVFRAEAKAEWVVSLSVTEKAFWESQSRRHVALQPTIRDSIIESLRANPSKSYKSIANDIGNWCSATAIHTWLASHGCCKYTQRALPLLTKEQMKKHVSFAKHLRNNWGLPRGKYLWIHFDEKWFYGWVSRATAKKCEQLGIERTHTYLYHKCHIEKVMGVAITGFAFDTNIENGGRATKIGFYRVQAARVAKRTQRESRKDEDGRTRYDGQIIREKGDVYLVECNVTGSDHGTSDKPQFALLDLFMGHLFPGVEELVGTGGEFEGYVPVFQGDNAGPHLDNKFVVGVKEFCDQKGWYWEPQAPQMPHINNLDLAVFPSMSKHHSALLSQYSNKMAPVDRIWEVAEAVWRDLPLATIARGFILANRVSAKVIASNGSNSFLQSRDFHCGVRKDFQDTPFGVLKKTSVVE
jgi:hypothetical protein